MSSSAINAQLFQAKIGSIQNQADSTSVYSAGVWSFKNSTAVTSVTIDNSGNVGIGTTSPVYRLDVSGGHARIRGAQAMFWTNSDNTNFSAIYNAGASGAANGQMVFETNSVERMRIDASGNLLVGTTSAQGTASALTVQKTTVRWGVGPTTGSGNFIIKNDSDVGVYVSNGGTSWIAYSDERMKKNIKPLALGLEQIKALKPTRFDYKTDESEESARIGFIAQEVLPVLPHAVSVPEDSEQMMGVSATEMIPVLVKAIQELSAKVDAQAEEIKALKAQP